MSERELRIDPDIRFATTPPAALYLDEDWFRLVAERVLARGWHVVAEASSIATKETALPVTLLPGALDEPLVLTRDRKARLHCLANACTDRGELVCPAAGPAKLLRCGTHGRTFRLDGELMEAPGFDGVPGFPSPSDSLARLPVAGWGPLVFASFAPAMPFEDVVRPLREACATPAPDAATAAAPTTEQDVDANWALWVEGALAAFAGDDVELHASGAVRAGPSTRAWIFPATFVDVAAHSVDVRVVHPTSAARTRLVHRAWTAAGERESMSCALDAARLAEQQRGLRSRAYRPGHYAPRRDRAVHHFHRLLAAALATS